MKTILQIKDLHVHYGVIHAIQGVSLDLYEQEIVSLIGANGAGKSTLLKAISGIHPSSSGEILYGSPAVRIDSLPPEKIVSIGIAQSPEGRQVFANLTVKENLKLGAYSRKGKVNFSQEMEPIFELFPRLKERLEQMAGTLSGGEQQMLAIGRALMAKPKLLLLDEPSLGIAPVLVRQIFEALKKINRQGMSILVVEQNAYLALETADRAYVLETGKIRLSGAAKELLGNPEVQKAYLGG